MLLSPREPYREDRIDRPVPATEPCRLGEGQWASTDTETRVDQRVEALILEYKVILHKPQLGMGSRCFLILSSSLPKRAE